MTEEVERTMELTLGCTTRPYVGLPFGEICERIAAAGYTDVAVFGNVGVAYDSSPEQVREVRKQVEDAGLLPSMWLPRLHLEVGLEEAWSRAQRIIDQAAALGATWLLTTGVSEPELYEDFVALMRRAAPYAEGAGVQITLKPHGGISLTTDDLISIHGQVNHPAFGICYDPGNIIYYTAGNERPETNVSKVAPLVTTGIIKDCVVVDGKPDVMVTPGEGWVDFHAVLSGLVEGGFRGPLYLECVGGTTLDEIDENVRGSLTLIHEILSAL